MKIKEKHKTNMGKWSKKSEKLFLDIKKYGPQINRKIYYKHIVYVTVLCKLKKKMKRKV